MIILDKTYTTSQLALTAFIIGVAVTVFIVLTVSVCFWGALELVPEVK